MNRLLDTFGVSSLWISTFFGLPLLLSLVSDLLSCFLCDAPGKYVEFLTTGSTLETAIVSLHEAEAKLKRIVRERFREAGESRDSASVERFFKLFSLLDMQTEGLDTFAAYVRDELQHSAHSLLEPVLPFEPSSAQPEPAEKPSSVFFADLLNLVLTSFSSSAPVNC